MQQQLYIVPLSQLFGPSPITEADARPAVQGFFPNRPKPLRKFIRNSIVERVMKDSGKDRKTVEEIVDAALAEKEAELAESDTPFLDWLMNGGLEKIIELILKLLSGI